jgi:hypothetical protein
VAGRFVFEDYRVDGNRLVQWLGCPMGYRRLLALMRLVLEEAGACTKMEVQGYTMHSAWHTLPLIARLRGETSADRPEIGRWSMSAAQAPAIRPFQSVMKRYNIAAAVVPDRYAQSVPAQAVFNVMERQVEVMRRYKQERDAEGLPRHETWESFQSRTGRKGARASRTAHTERIIIPLDNAQPAQRKIDIVERRQRATSCTCEFN